jgi:hypothetical protein
MQAPKACHCRVGTARRPMRSATCPTAVTRRPPRDGFGRPRESLIGPQPGAVTPRTGVVRAGVGDLLILATVRGRVHRGTSVLLRIEGSWGETGSRASLVSARQERFRTGTLASAAISSARWSARREIAVGFGAPLPSSPSSLLEWSRERSKSGLLDQRRRPRCRFG